MLCIRLTRRVVQGEKLGGLIIERGPASVSVEARRAMSVSRTNTGEVRMPNATVTASVSSLQSNKPPSARNGNPRTHLKGAKDRLLQIGEVGEDDVDEDVRQMNSEADELRDRSRASLANVSPDAPRVEFRFPAPKPPSHSSKSRVRKLQAEGLGPGTPPSRAGSLDTVIPLVERETPQIMKNKMMRGEHPSMKQSVNSRSTSQTSDENRGPVASSSQAPGHRRRTSMSMRGKRISAAFEASGIIGTDLCLISSLTVLSSLFISETTCVRIGYITLQTYRY